MSDDIDWKNVARSYQQENERLRLDILKRRNSKIDFNIDLNALVDFVQEYYVVIIIFSLLLSYIGSFCIDLYKARRDKC